MAGRATGPVGPAPITVDPVTTNGRVPLITMRDAPVSTAPVLPASAGVRRAFTAGRIGICAIPLLAVLAALGLKPSTAFSTDPAAYARFVADRWSSPMAVATTTATGVLTLISVVALALLLYGTRARWLALVGSVFAAAGSVMMMAAVGSVVVRAEGMAKPILHWRLDQARITAEAHGTDAAVLVLGGAALITLGFILLGLAVMIAKGLNRGDGGLLMVSAPMVFLGGFFLHVLPTMGAFLLGAAGLGIMFTADRIAPAVRAVPDPVRPARTTVPMSAFAGFTDQDLDELYAFEKAEPAHAPFLTPAEIAMIAAGYPDDTKLDDPRLNGARQNGAGMGTPQDGEAPLNDARRDEGWLTRNRRTPTGHPKTQPDKPAQHQRPAAGHSNGAHVNGTHASGAHVSGARPTRPESALGRLSRGISTAWQVRRTPAPSDETRAGEAQEGKTQDGKTPGGTTQGAQTPPSSTPATKGRPTGTAAQSSSPTSTEPGADAQRERGPAGTPRSTTTFTKNLARNFKDKSAAGTQVSSRVKGGNAKGGSARSGAKAGASVTGKAGRTKNRGASSGAKGSGGDSARD